MDDSRITEVEYRDFSLGFHRRIGSKHIPIKGQLELTFRCNLKCVHCYVAEDKTRHELSFQEITDILDQIHQEGCLWLSFTGGEPLMRTDFLDIYRYAKRKGFLITILTNGTLMSPEIVEYLGEEPPFSIDLTLNGVTEKTYESISQVPGSFRKVMKVIRLILDKKLPLRIKTKATRLNYHELDKIKQYVDSMGIELRLNAMLYPRLTGSLKPCSFRLSPDEIISLDRFYQNDGNCQENDLREDSFLPLDTLFRCAAGISSFHISPYGELIFCTFMRQPYFDLRKGSFKQGFYTLYPKIRSAKYRTNSQCKDCKIFYLCSQCPALAKLENAHLEKPIVYFCELAHKRAELRKEVIVKGEDRKG
ncbi:putative mycofactocin radical SAM maturase MftC [subsurface metagenome]